MRLPFLQVSQEGLARARTMARLLRIPEAHGVGIYVSLTAWALELAPDGDLSGRLQDQEPAVLLAAAVGWDGKPEDLLAAMERTRIVMRDASGTHAVAGLEVYERALVSSENRKVAASVAARARWDGKKDATRMHDASPSHGDAMRPDAKTQTQTQTQKAEDLPAPSSPTPRAELCLEQQEPPKRARQKRKDGAAPDPRHGPLAASLVAAGWPHHGGRTAKAISELLALADRIPPGLMPPEGAPAEVLRRAAIAKAYEGFPRVRELHELADKWGHFETTPTSGRGPAPPSDFSRNVPLPERSEFAPPVDDTPF